ERGEIVGLQKNKMNWTLEPGGQMETAGSPMRNVHQSAQETDACLREAVEIGKKLGIGLMSMGYHPKRSGEEMPTVPRSRYRAWRHLIEREKIPRWGDTISCTSAIQVSLGYESEENMVKMLRVALSLQPIVVAMFANSPFKEGYPSGYQSYRSEIGHNSM